MRIGAAARGVNWFVGVALGAIDADSLGTLNPLPVQPPLGVAQIVALGAGVEIVSSDFDAIGVDALRGVGLIVALGTSKRPRRCEVVGETEAVEIGVDAEDALALGVSVAARRGVVVDSGVEVAAADGAAVAVVDVPPA